MHSPRAPMRTASGRRAVSEVVGSVLLLLITVAAFAVLFLMVQGIPTPAPGVSSDFEASIEFTGPTSADVSLVHLGGAALENGSAVVVVLVDNASTSYSMSDGLGGGDTEFGVGSTWHVSLAGPVSNSSRVILSVVSWVSNELLYQTVLQEGETSGPGGHQPMITVAWAVSSAGDARVYNNGLQSYRIHAVVVDQDGDLNGTGGVFAKVTVVPDGALLSTTSIGSGTFVLVRTDGGHYQTADLVMSAGVFPGDYDIEVKAQDSTGLSSTALVPLEVINGNVGGGPTVTAVGTSTAPVAVEPDDKNVSVMRLDLSTVGETASISQVIVAKTGQLPDGQVTVAIWLDADESGTFDAGSDLQLTPPTAFTGGAASIFSVPILGVTEADPVAAFIVADFTGADDGQNVTFSITDGTDIRGTGVPSGATSSTAGSFPLASDEVVIGSRLQAEPDTGVPDRILKDDHSVRVLSLTVRAAGEDLDLDVLNLTLLGNIPRSSVQAYVSVDGSVASGTASFNAVRMASVPLSHLLTQASGWITLEIFINLTGGGGQTVGMELTAGADFHATGDQTSLGREAVSSAGFPIGSGTVSIAATGNLSVDPFNDAALATELRAGMSDAYMLSLILHAHGEDIDFNKLELTKDGNMADGDFVALTMRVRGGPWFSGTFFSGKVTWDAGVTGKLFAIPTDASNTGEAVVDIYANLSAGTQGKQTEIEVGSSAKVRGYGKTSLTTLNAGVEDEPYPLSSGVLKVMGDVYVTGFNLAPGYILTPETARPFLKLTLRAIGENMTLTEVFLKSLQGVPPSSSITVHLFRDVDNDTTTAVDGDDVELVPAQAGPFGSDAFKSFTPYLGITAGTDMNIYFAFDIADAAGGFSLETRVDTALMGFSGSYSGADIPANSVIGGPNPPALATQTPAVPIYHAGELTVSSVPRNPQPAHHVGTLQFFLRVDLTADSVESISVTSITFTLLGNVTPSDVRIDLWWDKNKNNATSTGEGDADYADGWFNSTELTFNLSPAVVVPAGGTEQLIVKVTLSETAQVGRTVGVSVAGSSSVSAVGDTSGWSMTPAGSFPRNSLVVPIAA